MLWDLFHAFYVHHRFCVCRLSNVWDFLLGLVVSIYSFCVTNR